jgi:hypothetical protein
VHLSDTEYSHSEVLKRWNTPFQNGIATLRGVGEMVCTFAEWHTHTLRFRRDGEYLSRMEYLHSKVLGRWSAPFQDEVHPYRMESSDSKVLERWSPPIQNGILTLRGFGEMESTFSEWNRIPTLQGFGEMKCTLPE